ncbi:MAG: hypothetical protein RIS64_798 [Bacteroidota bacterium]|jgi:hypothetical protein
MNISYINITKIYYNIFKLFYKKEVIYLKKRLYLRRFYSDFKTIHNNIFNNIKQF